MNWFKLECTTRAFVTALQLTVRYEMSVIIIIIIIIGRRHHTCGTIRHVDPSGRLHIRYMI